MHNFTTVLTSSIHTHSIIVRIYKSYIQKEGKSTNKQEVNYAKRVYTHTLHTMKASSLYSSFKGEAQTKKYFDVCLFFLK